MMPAPEPKMLANWLPGAINDPPAAVPAAVAPPYAAAEAPGSPRPKPAASRRRA